MSVPANFFDSYVVAASPGDASETVVAGIVGVTELLQNLSVHLHGWIDIAPDVGTTLLTLNIRRGADTTGSIVGTTTINGPGTATGVTEVQAIVDSIDNPGDFQGASYVLTATCTGAGGASTVNAVHLEARVG